MRKTLIALVAILVILYLFCRSRSGYNLGSDPGSYYSNMGSINYIRGPRYMPSVQDVMYSEPPPDDEPTPVIKPPTYSPGVSDVIYKKPHYGMDVQDTMYRRNKTGHLGTLLFMHI